MITPADVTALVMSAIAVILAVFRLLDATNIRMLRKDLANAADALETAHQKLAVAESDRRAAIEACKDEQAHHAETLNQLRDWKKVAMECGDLGKQIQGKVTT